MSPISTSWKEHDHAVSTMGRRWVQFHSITGHGDVCMNISSIISGDVPSRFTWIHWGHASVPSESRYKSTPDINLRPLDEKALHSVPDDARPRERQCLCSLNSRMGQWRETEHRLGCCRRVYTVAALDTERRRLSSRAVLRVQCRRCVRRCTS